MPLAFARPRLARAFVALSLAALAGAGAGVAFLAPPGPVGAHARVEVAPHFLPEAASGRVAAVVILEIDAPARLAVRATRVQVDVAFAGVPVGRVAADREPGSPLTAPRFRLPVSIEAPPTSLAMGRLADAFESSPGAVDLAVVGRVRFALGDESAIEIRERVRIVLDATQAVSVPTQTAFSPAAAAPRDGGGEGRTSLGPRAHG